MSHFAIDDLTERLAQEGSDYFELLDEESVTVEIGRYTSGIEAAENAHADDEIYWIVSGSGTIQVGDETHAVEPGDMVYVERGTKHGFVEVDDDLTVFILFAGPDTGASYADGSTVASAADS